MDIFRNDGMRKMYSKRIQDLEDKKLVFVLFSVLVVEDSLILSGLDFKLCIEFSAEKIDRVQKGLGEETR